MRKELLQQALDALVNQVRKTNPVDDRGHIFAMNRAYIEAVEYLDAIAQPTMPAQPAELECWYWEHRLNSGKVIDSGFSRTKVDPTDNALWGAHPEGRVYTVVQRLTSTPIVQPDVQPTLKPWLPSFRDPDSQDGIYQDGYTWGWNDCLRRIKEQWQRVEASTQPKETK